MNISSPPAMHENPPPKVGIVLSRFNEEVGNGLLRACLAELVQAGVGEHNIHLIRVPGALEIPIMLASMAEAGGYDGFIALGAVIRGETYHFEVVSNESARGIVEVQLITGIPVANAILTTENDEQALERMAVKGREAAQVVLEMIETIRGLQKTASISAA